MVWIASSMTVPTLGQWGYTPPGGGGYRPPSYNPPPYSYSPPPPYSVRDVRGRLSGLSILHRKSRLYGSFGDFGGFVHMYFVWAHRPLNIHFCRFSARAVHPSPVPVRHPHPDAEHWRLYVLTPDHTGVYGGRGVPYPDHTGVYWKRRLHPTGCARSAWRRRRRRHAQLRRRRHAQLRRRRHGDRTTAPHGDSAAAAAAATNAAASIGIGTGTGTGTGTSEGTIAVSRHA